MLEQKIGFVGAGQMATALGQGFVRAGLVEGSRLLAADPVAEATARISRLEGMEGHALTARLTDDLPFPFLLLLVSGGQEKGYIQAPTAV